MVRKKREFAYYDFRRAMSYNAVYNMIVGARSLGKTYGAKKDAIKAYIRKRDEFVYLRRYQTEMSSKQTFFEDIKHEFPEHGFRVNGNLAEITFNPHDEKPHYEIMGYFRVLSKGQAQKSQAYPNVTRIIFDEFIIEKGSIHYLPNEVDALNNFFLTVDRFQDKTRVLMLANSISIMNPYFLEWKIQPTKEFVTAHDGFVLAHFADSEMFKNQVLETRFGKFIAGTGYGDFATGNVFADGHSFLVAKKNAQAQYYMTIETAEGVFSVWYDRYSPVPTYFIQEKRPKEELIWTLEADMMGEGKVLIPYNHKFLQYLRASFAQGYVWFDSPKSRNAFVYIFNR